MVMAMVEKRKGVSLAEGGRSSSYIELRDSCSSTSQVQARGRLRVHYRMAGLMQSTPTFTCTCTFRALVQVQLEKAWSRTE